MVFLCEIPNMLFIGLKVWSGEMEDPEIILLLVPLSIHVSF